MLVHFLWSLNFGNQVRIDKIQMWPTVQEGSSFVRYSGVITNLNNNSWQLSKITLYIITWQSLITPYIGRSYSLAGGLVESLIRYFLHLSNLQVVLRWKICMQLGRQYKRVGVCEVFENDYKRKFCVWPHKLDIIHKNLPILWASEL